VRWLNLSESCCRAMLCTCSTDSTPGPTQTPHKLLHREKNSRQDTSLATELNPKANTWDAPLELRCAKRQQRSCLAVQAGCLLCVHPILSVAQMQTEAHWANVHVQPYCADRAWRHQLSRSRVHYHQYQETTRTLSVLLPITTVAHGFGTTRTI
jgi:hypothetical protein